MLEKGRVTAWLVAHGLDPHADIPFYTVPAPSLLGPEDIKQWLDDVDIELAHLGHAGERLGLVVLDTVAKVMLGMDGNSTKEAGEYVRFAEGVGEHWHCPSLSLGHVNKVGDVMGSNAFRQGLDTVLHATRAPDGIKATKLQVLKHRDADERETPWYLEGKMIPDTGNMVLEPISAGDWQALVHKDDMLSGANIGATLARLEAQGQENGKACHVLARELLRGKDDSDASVDKMVKTLTKLARQGGTLAGYVPIGQPSGPWFLPDPAAHC